MFGVKLLLLSGIMTLASSPVECTLPKAPEIEVIPKTAPTAYDNSKPLEELNKIKAGTISPYGNFTEQLVFGLHEGTMKLAYESKIGGAIHEDKGIACLYFEKVKITLELNPVIYVVKELRSGSCPHRAVLEHEKKHVRADRVIANKYAREIGLAVQKAVDKVGAIGPFNVHELEARQKMMTDHIASTVKTLELQMVEEQNQRQQEVDTLEEYDAVNKEIRDVCNYNIPEKLKDTLKRMHRNERFNR